MPMPWEQSSKQYRSASGLAYNTCVTTAYAISIDELDLTVRTYNVLKRNLLTTLGRIADMSENDLLDLRNFGQGCVDEIKGKLAERGLSLRDAGCGIAEITESTLRIFKSAELSVTFSSDGTGAVSKRNGSVHLEPSELQALLQITAKLRGPAAKLVNQPVQARDVQLGMLVVRPGTETVDPVIGVKATDDRAYYYFTFDGPVEGDNPDLKPVAQYSADEYVTVVSVGD